VRKLKRKELEEGLSAVVMAAAEMLEDLHVAHCAEDVENFLTIKVGNTTLANVINNLYKVVLPVIDLARRKFKKFFAVFDWAALVVQKLFAI